MGRLAGLSSLGLEAYSGGDGTSCTFSAAAPADSCAPCSEKVKWNPYRNRPLPTLSYCVVNTNGREYLLACLDAIERTHPAGIEREILVLDNASTDGSAQAVRARGGEMRLIALGERAGKAADDSTLMREAKGRYCLLLNEDSELRPGAAGALLAALEAEPRAAAATAQLLDSSGAPVPCAWRFPGVGVALAGALLLHRWLTVQSKGS